MKNVFKLFSPHFLKKFDQFLLEKHPFLWSKRVGHVLFFGTLILGFNVALCSLIPINIYTYTSMWVFVWFATVPAVLFLLVWLFFQYKYELAWDYAKLGWNHYFKTGLSYTLVCAFCLAMVVVPNGIYQSRVNTYYMESISIKSDALYDSSHSIASTYMDDYYASNTNFEELQNDPVSFEEAKESFINKLFSQLDYLPGAYPIDTLILPEIEPLYSYTSLLKLSQYGDTTERYMGSHYWLVFLNTKETANDGRIFYNGTMKMFSPWKYYSENSDYVHQQFDSTNYLFESFFHSHWLSYDVDFPRTSRGSEYNWEPILTDSNYYVETQTIRCFDKVKVATITDNRLEIEYPKYKFTSMLMDQGKEYDDYYVGATVRGNNKLFRESNFYELKRFEYFLFKRFGIQNIDLLTTEFVETNIIEMQQFAKLLYSLERDLGDEFTEFNIGIGFVYLCIIYVVSAIIAIILLTLRLLNLRLLVLSVISLCVLSFILFVPMAVLSIDGFHGFTLLFLTGLFAALQAAVVRLNCAKSCSKFMIVSALAGLVTLPLITLFYYFYFVNKIEFANYEDQLSFSLLWGSVLSVVFLFGHITLITSTIHKAFYLPKR